MQISPIMEYTSEVWFQNKSINNLEKIHLSYMKNILRTKTSTSTIALYSELGRFPIALRLKCRLVNYWKRLIGFNSRHPVKQAYNTLLNLNNMGQTNWCTTLRNILSETNHLHLWDEQSITDKQYQLIKESLYTEFIKITLQQINNTDTNPKLRTYKLFKNHFQFKTFFLHPNKHKSCTSTNKI